MKKSHLSDLETKTVSNFAEGSANESMKRPLKAEYRSDPHLKILLKTAYYNFEETASFNKATAENQSCCKKLLIHFISELFWSRLPRSQGGCFFQTAPDLDSRNLDFEGLVYVK